MAAFDTVIRHGTIATASETYQACLLYTSDAADE